MEPPTVHRARGGSRGSRRRGLAATTLAAALHAALLGALGRPATQPLARPMRQVRERKEPATEISLEEILQPQGKIPPRKPPPREERQAEASRKAADPKGSARPAVSSRRRPRRNRSPEGSQRARGSAKAKLEHAGGAAPPPSELSRASSRPAPGSAAVPDESGSAGKRGRPRLTLEQLGVGSVNPLLGTTPQKPSLSAEARLERDLRAHRLKGDQQRGLGPEGPILPMLREAVISDTELVRSRAELVFEVDAEGRVLRARVLRAESRLDRWRKIAQRTTRMLEGKRLRVPAGAQGFRIRLAAAVRPQLPSGAASRLERGTGPSFSLGFRFDVANIGATAQRTARLRVVSVEAVE